MQEIRVEKTIAGRTLSIETGTVARQAAGSVTVQYGDTVVLAAVARGAPRPGIDFFPLQVEYRERRSAAGKFPGGFMKREGRPSNREVLIMRMVDRPLRPLLPDGFKDELQIHLNVLSYDGVNDPDVIAGIAASAALAVSDIPFDGPTAHVRCGLVPDENDELQQVLMPTIEQQADSDIDLVLAGTKDLPNMIEVGAFEVEEEEVTDLIEFGHKAIKDICGLIDELADKVGRKEKVVLGPSDVDADLVQKVHDMAFDKIKAAKGEPGKLDRADKIKAIRDEVMDALAPEPEQDAPYFLYQERTKRGIEVGNAFRKVEKKATRALVLDGTRPDGRKADEIRDITHQVGVIPRVHGSSLFTRGETQSLCTVTLGTSGDDQMVDGLTEEYAQKFMLHYNFPPYSVGEVRRLGGVSRRELGHGALAEKGLLSVMPEVEDFPYTVRVISDITESNGSSSMASACAGCLAMMDAGVPITDMVAGISVGVIKDGEGSKAKFHLLTDILGEEDGFGDMDFKVIGTEHGITAIQLDIKIAGLPIKVIKDTLKRAKDARLGILKGMKETIAEPRADISKYAPKLISLKIDPEKIGKVIGPSGKTIRKIQEETGARIDIDDDGTVQFSASTPGGAEKARDIVEAMTQQVQEGRIYKGEIVSIKDFGAFVEIAPETDGLLHVSEISNNYVERVGDHLKVGDELEVKVIRIDEQGRIKLSRKAVLEERGEKDDIGVPRKPKGENGGDDEGGSRRRGGRRRGGSSNGDREEASAEKSSSDDQPRRRRRRGSDDD
ncbi:MAG: polyribonucleotide nucleotidyltransferase [Planctomycetota bacterium]